MLWVEHEACLNDTYRLFPDLIESAVNETTHELATADVFACDRVASRSARPVFL